MIGNDAPTPDEEGVWRHTSLARPYVSPEVGIEPTAVALGRGSMIFLNGRTYHGVSSQPPASANWCAHAAQWLAATASSSWACVPTSALST